MNEHITNPAIDPEYQETVNTVVEACVEDERVLYALFGFAALCNAQETAHD